MHEELKIIWYGRCCFLAEINGKRILFDPYDRFCNIDIGLIDAEILLVSSSWHDHGHIGCSPGAWIFSYAGIYEHQGLKIFGMEVKEERGSPTVIFNVQTDNFSITNFADMGVYEKEVFNYEQKNILKSTNIAFIRSGHERVLEFCQPKIIIPEHYFPRSFIEEQIPQDKQNDFENQNIEIDKMLDLLKFPIEEIDNYRCGIDLGSIPQTKVLKLLKVHPQVKFRQIEQFRKYW